MQSELTTSPAKPPVYSGATALLLSLTLFTTGCLAPMAKHSNALAAATAPVVDEAAAAYRSANALHDVQLNYLAYAEFDTPPPNVYNPRTVQPLMSDKDIAARLAVLASFQAFAKSLVAITAGTDSPELQAASASAGSGIASLGNSLAPAIETTFGIAAASAAATPAATTETITTTTSGNTTTATSSTAAVPAIPAPPVNPITPTIQNGVSTAINAFGQLLINRRIKKELPPIIHDMGPNVTVLCDLLKSDIAILKDQEVRDYNFIIDRNTLFIRTTKNLDPEVRREQIMKLPGIVRQQRASDQQLAQLSASINTFESAYSALAAEAKGDNPEPLMSKLVELVGDANDLGKFYSSLPTQ
jgi:hypothetical protein